EMYSMGTVRKTPPGAGTPAVPFIQDTHFQGPRGEIVRIRSIFDDGSMTNAIDADMFDAVAHRLSPLAPSPQRLRMANGTIVPSKGRWEGHVTIGGLPVYARFEVFPSGGSWSVLVGKPLLIALNATHTYGADTISLPTIRAPVILTNKAN
ncbi:hypothetical protein BV25DRAFT_1778322, partial [Artomyces pyxidatus]